MFKTTALKTTKWNTYDKNGNLVKEEVTNSLPGTGITKKATEYKYNNMNRIIENSVTEKDGKKYYTQYQYDNSGNQIKVSSGNGKNVMQYEYDHMERPTKIIYPKDLSNRILSEIYLYDNDGNMISKTDRNGTVTSYAYDGLGRILKEIAGTNKRVYEYGSTGLRTMEQNETTTIRYSYTNNGNVLNESYSANGINYQYNYSYDNRGNRTGITFRTSPNNASDTLYKYDNMDRLIEVRYNSLVFAQYTYDKNGNRKTAYYPRVSIGADYQYNMANMVTKVEYKKGTNVLSRYEYDYYLDGNTATEKDLSGKITSYAYNNRNYITTETDKTAQGNIFTKTYTYDEAGNRIKLDTAGDLKYSIDYTYDSNNKLLNEVYKKDTITEQMNHYYDNNGNQVKTMKGNTIYEEKSYDKFNQLSSLKKGNQTAQYIYKPDGIRLSKNVNNKKTNFVTVGGNIFAELDQSGNVIERYVRDMNNIIGCNHEYYLYNGHGDVTQLTRR